MLRCKGIVGGKVKKVCGRKCRDQSRQSMCERCYEWYRKAHLKRTFGLTLEAYDTMVRGQGGRCAICFKLPGKRPLDIDHDHKSGRVRGLLCNNCNTALGKLDTPELLKRAQEYLGE